MKIAGLLSFAALGISFQGFAQNDLAVQVDGVKTSGGHIRVAVYNKAAGFLKMDQVYASNSVLAQKGTTHILIEDLPAGEYALAIFHDENGNNVLDANWIGIPKEAVGFSHAAMKAFGPPSYQDCVVQIPEEKDILIVL